MTTNASGSVSAVDSTNKHHSALASLSMLSNATVSVSTTANQPHDTATAPTPKPKPKPRKISQFWAIRQCEGLHSPAIFSNWEDCSGYVDPMENDGSVIEFKSFPTVQEATAYAFGASATVPTENGGADHTNVPFSAQTNEQTQRSQPQSPPLPTTVTPASGTTNHFLVEVDKTAALSGTADFASNKITSNAISPLKSRANSNNSEGSTSTWNNAKVAADETTSSSNAQNVPAVTPTEMDVIDGKSSSDGSDGGARGGRNYRRSVNTTYSSGEDEPVEESTGKDPVAPSDDDVLCGRGGLTNHHPGNKRFRSIVKQNQQEYLTADRGKKASFGHKIYSEIQSHQGRFLQRIPGGKQWYDIGKVRAIAKICQALREDAPTIRGGKRQSNRSQQSQSHSRSHSHSQSHSQSQSQSQQQAGDSNNSLKRPLPKDTPDMAQVVEPNGPTASTPNMSTPPPPPPPTHQHHRHHMTPQEMTAYHQSQSHSPQPPPHLAHHPYMHMHRHYPSPASIRPGMHPTVPPPEASPSAPPQKMQKRLSHLDQLLAAANMAQAPNPATAAASPEGRTAPSSQATPQSFGGHTTPVVGTPNTPKQHDFPAASHTSPHVVMFMKTCVPLQGGPPPYFQGNMDLASQVNLPEFMMLANYPNIGQNQCKMCGLERALKSRATKTSAAKKDLHKEPTIPSQNKGVCTACDSQIWVVVDERQEAGALNGSQIKWCKGCKNFRPWATFGFKGSATKCAPCRESQAERYKGRKQAKQQQNTVQHQPKTASTNFNKRVDS